MSLKKKIRQRVCPFGGYRVAKNSCCGVVRSDHICHLKDKIQATVPAMLVVELSVTLDTEQSLKRLYLDNSRVFRSVVMFHCLILTRIQEIIVMKL